MTEGNFEWALRQLKQGMAMRRESWMNILYVKLQRPDEGSKMTLPYIYAETTTTGNLVPWLASQTDLLADDWEYAE